MSFQKPALRVSWTAALSSGKVGTMGSFNQILLGIENYILPWNNETSILWGGSRWLSYAAEPQRDRPDAGLRLGHVGTGYVLPLLTSGSFCSHTVGCVCFYTVFSDTWELNFRS